MFFLNGWLFKVAYYFSMIWLASPAHFTANEFLGAILNVIFNPFWNIFPLVYILYQHHKVFKGQLKQPTAIGQKQ